LREKSSRKKYFSGKAGYGLDFGTTVIYISMMTRKQYPRGVFKFRTIEEAQKAREKHLPLK
jgi:hypothetical protein